MIKFVIDTNVNRIADLCFSLISTVFQFKYKGAWFVKKVFLKTSYIQMMHCLISFVYKTRYQYLLKHYLFP